MSGHRVLLLNQSYQPLQGISLKKAMKHISKGKADVVHYDESSVFYSGKETWKVPTVIRLSNTNYIRPFAHEPRYSKPSIHARDGFKCAYCEKVFKAKDLTIDHIVPRSKGGLTSWTNCITACKKCNSYKADFSIEETKMYLRFQPYIPKSAILFNNYKYKNHPDWSMYLSKLK